MARPKSPNAKRSWVSFRCTNEELFWWGRLAAKRDLSIPAMIQAGLSKIIESTCLCEPDQPVCPKCFRSKENQP